MKLVIAPEAKEQLKDLPKYIQKKAERQFNFLVFDYRHPSLRSRKMHGGDIFEGRIDIHYRFTFLVEQDTISILTIGTHDEGLGKS